MASHRHPTYPDGEPILVGDSICWRPAADDDVGEFGTVTGVAASVVVVGGTDRVRPQHLLFLGRPAS